jgi:hypothetical protein
MYSNKARFSAFQIFYILDAFDRAVELNFINIACKERIRKNKLYIKLDLYINGGGFFPRLELIYFILKKLEVETYASLFGFSGLGNSKNFSEMSMFYYGKKSTFCIFWKDFFSIHQKTVSLTILSSDSTTKLMKLCQSEFIRMIDNNSICLKEVHPILNNGS